MDRRCSYGCMARRQEDLYGASTTAAFAFVCRGVTPRSEVKAEIVNQVSPVLWLTALGHTLPQKKLIKKNHQNIEKRFLYYKCILAWGFRAALEILFVMLCELARRQQFKHSAPICGCCALPLSSVGGNIDWLTTASQRFSLWCVSLICVSQLSRCSRHADGGFFFFFKQQRLNIRLLLVKIRGPALV